MYHKLLGFGKLIQFIFREGYKTEYQRTSIIQAKLLYDLTGKGFRMYFSEEDSFLSLMEAKLFPL